MQSQVGLPLVFPFCQTGVPYSTGAEETTGALYSGMTLAKSSSRSASTTLYNAAAVPVVPQPLAPVHGELRGLPEDSTPNGAKGHQRQHQFQEYENIRYSLNSPLIEIYAWVTCKKNYRGEKLF